MIKELLIALISVGIGFFISRHLYSKQKKDERRERHFEKIKKEVLEPWQSSKWMHVIGGEINNTLFNDLKNHYPEIINQYKKLLGLNNELAAKLNLVKSALENKYRNENIAVDSNALRAGFENQAYKEYHPRIEGNRIMCQRYGCVKTEVKPEILKEVVIELLKLYGSDKGKEIREMLKVIAGEQNSLKEQIQVILSQEKLHGDCNFL